MAGTMFARAGLLLFAALAGGPLAAAGRQAIGVHGSWGAFKDGARCYAVSEPAEQFRRGDRRPFASVVQVPGRARGQIHIRLRFAKLRGAPVRLAVGDQRFQLVAGGANAWAPNDGVDSAIIAAMRSASSMSIETRARDGRPFVDVYRLRGAATAIDAATLACAG